MSEKPAELPHAKERDYTLKILQFPAVHDRAKAKKKPAKVRHSSATVTWLYRRFVEGHLPRYPTGSQFIAVTVPFLCRAMCPEAVAIMGAVFARRNCPKEQAAHVKATIAQAHAMRAVAVSELPQSARDAIASLQPRCRAHATTAAIAAHSLADSRDQFFMDCRSLQRRLLLTQPRSALRVLERLESIGILERLESGAPLWSDGPRKANAYAWKAK